LSIHTNLGKFTTKYINKYGNREEPYKIGDSLIKRKFSQRRTFKARKVWYHLPRLKPTNLILIKSFNDVIYLPFSDKPVLCDQRAYTFYTSLNIKEIWKYLVSTVFLLTIELYCSRLGGGASDIRVEDYEEMPVPNFHLLKIDFDPNKLLSRHPLRFDEEVRQSDRRELDKAVLRALGFGEPELDELVDELHKAFVEVVEDRLIKAGRPLREEEQELEERVSDDQDN